MNKYSWIAEEKLLETVTTRTVLDFFFKKCNRYENDITIQNCLMKFVDILWKRDYLKNENVGNAFNRHIMAVEFKNREPNNNYTHQILVILDHLELPIETLNEIWKQVEQI